MTTVPEPQRVMMEIVLMSMVPGRLVPTVAGHMVTTEQIVLTITMSRPLVPTVARRLVEMVPGAVVEVVVGLVMATMQLVLSATVPGPLVEGLWWKWCQDISWK